MKRLTVALLVLVLGGCTDEGGDSPTGGPVTPTAELTYNATVLDESLEDGIVRARFVVTNAGDASGYVAPLNGTTSAEVWDLTTDSLVPRAGPEQGRGASTHSWNDDDMVEIPSGASRIILYQDGAFDLNSGHDYQVRFHYVYYPPEHHDVTVPVENEFTAETTWAAP